MQKMFNEATESESKIDSLDGRLVLKQRVGRRWIILAEALLNGRKWFIDGHPLSTRQAAINYLWSKYR